MRLCSNVREISSPQHRLIKSSNDVTGYRGESDVIYSFYLSILRRRYLLYIGAHRE